jgi:hypothetical protein
MIPMGSSLTSMARVVAAVRSGVAAAEGIDLRAVAEGYAERCRAAVERLERCGAEVERGEVMAALRGAESWPPLRDVIALLDIPERGAWEALCAGRGLAVAPRFPAQRLDQLASLQAGEAALIPRLYREYRGLVMQLRDAEALAVIRTIARIRPDDADAQSEKSRLEEKVVAALTGRLQAATAAGRTAEAAAISDELADFRSADPASPESVPPVLPAEPPPAAPVSPAGIAVVRPSGSVRVPAAVSRPRPVAKPAGPRIPPLPEAAAKAPPRRRRWQTLAFTSAGIAAAGISLWLTMKPAPPPVDDAAAEAEAAVVRAISDSRTASELRGIPAEPAVTGRPPAEMLKAIQQPRAPASFEDCLSQLPQLEREFGSSTDRAPAVFRMFQLLEQEALAWCVRSRTRPPAFQATLNREGKLTGYQWKDEAVAGTFRTLARFAESGNLPDKAFPSPQGMPSWVASEIAAAKAAAQPPQPTTASEAAEPVPEPAPALDDASVARLSILPGWEALPTLRPGPEWLASMAVIPRHQTRILLTKSGIGFVGKGRLAEGHVFSVQEGTVARRSRGDLLGIDLIGNAKSGVWRVYCAAAAGFPDVGTSLADPFADHSLRWDAEQGAFQLSETTHTFLNRIRLLPGQSWQLECPFAVSPGGHRSLPITSRTVPFPLHGRQQQQRSAASLAGDPVIKAIHARMLSEKQKLALSIRMQESSADKDPIANTQRSRRIREYEDAFNEIMRGLQFEMEERVRALMGAPSSLADVPQELPGSEPFHVNLVSDEASPPPVRLIALTPRP